MSEEEVIDRLHRLRRDPRVVSAALAVVVLASGVAWLRSSGSSPPAATAEAPAPALTTSTTAPPATAFVHVVGAVRAPGVVQLPAGARVADAIAAAGGAGDGADLARVNLAARVTDGQRIAVPLVGEPLPAGAVTGGTEGDTGGPVDLNTATAEQLEALPGIGPTLAGAIVSERERMGGFRSVDDLQRVRGIGPARFEQLRELVTV